MVVADFYRKYLVMFLVISVIFMSWFRVSLWVTDLNFLHATVPGQ